MGRLLRILLVASILFIIISVVWYFFFPEEADTLFVNAIVYTVNQDYEKAEAIAVRQERIVAVGSRSSMERRFRPKATVDLNGKTVFPGFIDAHAHLLSLGIARMTVDLAASSTEREAAGRITSRVSKSQKGQWIRGRGWDQNLWPSRKFPTHRSLDTFSRNNPVFLTRIDGHACWVNTEALKAAGITKRTKDPDGGKIIRDTNGNPTGVFVDAAMELVAKHLPPLSRKESVDALSLAVDECLQYGITSVHDMGVDSADIELYKRAIDMHQFPLRVYAAIGGTGETWNQFLRSGLLLDYGSNKLTVRAIKLYIDGALGSRGAALIEPYSDDPGNRGLTLSSEMDLRNAVDMALKHGFQVCVHAIGDRGNNIALNVYEAALKDNPVADHRLRVEHAQVLNAEDIPRFQQLGVIPSMQPTHCTSDMYWAEARLGPRRVRGAYAWRSLLETGVIIAGGSDFPVEDPNPLFGIYAAMTRKDHQGRPSSAEDAKTFFQLPQQGIQNSQDFINGWYGAQKMTREEAVKSFTRWAAYAEFQENEKGSLESGKLADFVVLSNDIMTVPAKELLNTKVEMTVVGGKIVYRREQPMASNR
ncbi:MAG: amidohydrolase [Ignavibacteriales bacterium]|nr:amidohydrolase [Ignavibacteriales bacterium]